MTTDTNRAEAKAIDGEKPFTRTSMLRMLIKSGVICVEALSNPAIMDDNHVALRSLRQALELTEPYLERLREELGISGPSAEAARESGRQRHRGDSLEFPPVLPTLWSFGKQMWSQDPHDDRSKKTFVLQGLYGFLLHRVRHARREVRRLEILLEGKKRRGRRRRGRDQGGGGGGEQETAPIVTYPADVVRTAVARSRGSLESVRRRSDEGAVRGVVSVDGLGAPCSTRSASWPNKPETDRRGVDGGGGVEAPAFVVDEEARDRDDADSDGRFRTSSTTPSGCRRATMGGGSGSSSRTGRLPKRPSGVLPRESRKSSTSSREDASSPSVQASAAAGSRVTMSKGSGWKGEGGITGDSLSGRTSGKGSDSVVEHRVLGRGDVHSRRHFEQRHHGGVAERTGGVRSGPNSSSSSSTTSSRPGPGARHGETREGTTQSPSADRSGLFIDSGRDFVAHDHHTATTIDVDRFQRPVLPLKCHHSASRASSRCPSVAWSCELVVGRDGKVGVDEGHVHERAGGCGR